MKARKISLLLVFCMLFTFLPIHINAVAEGIDTGVGGSAVETPVGEPSYGKQLSYIFDETLYVPFAFSDLPEEDGRHHVTIEHSPEALELADDISMTIATEDTAPLSTSDGFIIVPDVQYQVTVTYHFAWFTKTYAVDISVMHDNSGDPPRLSYSVVDSFETTIPYEGDIILPELELIPMIVSEAVSKRGEFEKHFLCDDGSFIAVSYPEPVHMQVDDQWVDIELPLVEENDRIVLLGEDADISLAQTTTAAEEDGLVNINKDNHDLKWTVEVTETASMSSAMGSGGSRNSLSGKTALRTNIDANVITESSTSKQVNTDLLSQKNTITSTLDAGSGEMSLSVAQMVVETNAAIEAANRDYIQNVSFGRATVEYPDAFGNGATLRYVLSTGRIKEEVVLEEFGDFESYTAHMDAAGMTLVLQEDNGILVQDEFGETVLTVATSGYGAQAPKEVTITNTGNTATGALTIALSGSNSGSFTLSKTSQASLAAGGTGTFTVFPKTGLSAGTYTTTVKVYNSNVPERSFSVSFTVNSAPIYNVSLSQTGTYTFPAATSGYGAQASKEVTITNTGNTATGALTIALSGSNVSSFTLSKTTQAILAAGGTGTFTVFPKTGLSVGTYSAKVTVSNSNVPAKAFDVSFTVTAAPTYSVLLDQTGTHTFPAATVGYGQQASKTVKITNNGNISTGSLTIALSGSHADSFSLSNTTQSSLGVGSTGTFTVVPKTDLSAGTHSAIVTVSNANVTPQSFGVSFIVSADDHGDSFSNATYLGTISNTVSYASGAINPSGDVDFFRFAVPGTNRYSTYTLTVPAGFVATVYDVNQSVISAISGNPNQYVLRSGINYIRISRSSSSNQNYNVGIVRSDDHENSQATATHVSVANSRGSMGGSIETQGDTDLFSFIPTASGYHTIYLEGGPSLQCYLSDSSGKEVYTRKGTSSIVTQLTQGQTYYVRVADFTTSAGKVSSYTLKIDGVDDYSDNIQSPSKINVGTSVAGVINSEYDFEFFTFTVTKSGTYPIYANGDHMEVFLRDANKNIIFKSYSEIGSPISYMANNWFNAGETYILEVRRAGTGTGSYLLNIDMPMSKAVIVVPGAMGSRLEIGDERIWEPTLEDGALCILHPGEYSLTCLLCYKMSLLECNADGEPKYQSVKPDEDNKGAQDSAKDLIRALTESYAGQYAVDLFEYDWRLNLEDSAVRLSNYLAQYEEVILVCHSMGGLVASQYLKTNPSHRSKVKKLITLGTPYTGSLMMLKALETGEIMDGVADLAMSRHINKLAPNMYPIYQLLPSSRHAPLFARSIGSAPLRNYDEIIQFLSERPWCNSNIFQEGTQFLDNLKIGNVPVSHAVNAAYIVGVGTLTPSCMVYDYKYNPYDRLQYLEIYHYTDGGDGTVLHGSANNMSGGSYHDAKGVGHGDLMADATVISKVKDLIDGVFGINQRLMSLDPDTVDITFNLRGWTSEGEDKYIDIVTEGYDEVVIYNNVTGGQLDIRGDGVYSGADDNAERLGSLWMLDWETNRMQFALTDGEYKVEYGGLIDSNEPDSGTLLVQYQEKGYYHKVVEFQSSASQTFGELIVTMHDSRGISLKTPSDQVIAPVYTATAQELAERNTDDPATFLSSETVSSSGASLLVTVRNASAIAMFGNNSGVASTNGLGLVTEFIPDAMSAPFHIFDTPPEWGCAIDSYGGAQTYLLKNAAYYLSFISENSDAEITVQKISIIDDEVIVEDYEAQIDQYDDHYFVSIQGE